MLELDIARKTSWFKFAVKTCCILLLSRNMILSESICNLLPVPEFKAFYWKIAIEYTSLHIILDIRLEHEYVF